MFPRVYLGCPGWNAGLDRLWAPGSSPKTRLSQYAAHFPAVELNASFHAVPERKLTEGWAEAVPASFRFCAKVPRTVSHGGEWPTIREDAARFMHAWEGFGARAGPSFFQAPPEAGPEHLEELMARIELLGPAVSAVEVRHPDWFRRGRLHPALRERLQARGLCCCISDTPGRRDVVHGSWSGPQMIIRFMADPDAPSTRSRLQGWAQRLDELATQGVREVYWFIHQPQNLGLLQTAALAREVFGARAVPPEPPPAATSGQLRLF